MIDLENVEHHPALAEIVEVLCNKTQNPDRGFFQTVTAYFLAKIASNMRATINTKDRGEIPVNLYAIAMAPSGYGKGYSVTTFEQALLKGFTRRFVDTTFNTIGEQNLWKIANERSSAQGTDQQEEFDKAEKMFKSAGPFPFTFDSGTSPAVKQLRDKLLMANIGAINFQMDELGSNLEGNAEVLNVFLELYDQGLTKQKLVKNTAENLRFDQIDGKTPANMLLFGTPEKLFDGHSTERAFHSFLEIGYARRCIFGMGSPGIREYHSQTPEEVYRALTQTSSSTVLDKWSKYFHQLADPSMFEWVMDVEDEVGIKLIEYKMACEIYAESLPEHMTIHKAEISHRYFKALKLAGAYAFIDQSSEVELDHLMSAILLVEESGEAFQKILSREQNFVKLAKFIATAGKELTHPELKENLPFFTGSQGARGELITLATAWGYKNHIVIKKTYVDNIEFFEGQTLQETDTQDMILSYSNDWAYNYERTAEDGAISFGDLHNLTQAEGMHWCNHEFKNGHRCEENVIPGFNMIVLDLDGGTNVEMAHELMKDYRFMTYTTKRHSAEQHRFRMMIPINYRLELTAEDYKIFMNSILEWLPFNSDEASNQRSKKWESFDGGVYHYNPDGELFDALSFIPKTSKNEAHRNQMQELQSLDSLERWFAQRMETGNRNNTMIKYALALVDSGMSIVEVSAQVHSFNDKLGTSLSRDEIDNTIMVTVGKRYHKAAA